MEFWNTAIFVGALLLLVSIVASDISSRMGAPLLLVFLALGMLAGEDGPGGIQFDDFDLAYVIGTLALAVIIFDGGMRTRREHFRVALWPAVALAGPGVVISAALVGLFAAWLLGLSWLQGMLIGAIVGSTDAAAVFGLLRRAGANLQERVASTLEIESASNDPMAIFLTVALLELLAAGRTELDASVLLAFLQQFGIGALLGLGGGRLLVWLINRLTLASGLYPLLAVAGGLLVFAVTAQLGGSGFLAIFLAGLVLGNSELQAAQNILRVQDGLAWLSQIVMFLILGLLITPSELVPVALPALGIAAFLILVARPLAVLVCLLPFRFPWREQMYVSWVGLRGAVPVVLALFPVMYEAPDARLYFNVAFFIVLVSLLLQGWTIAPAARLLRLEVPPSAEPLQRLTLDMPGHFEHEILGYQIQPGSLVAARDLATLELPQGVQIMAVMRDGVPQALSPQLSFAPGDYVYVLAQPKRLPQVNKLFDPHQAPDRLEEHRYFGDFVLNGEATLADLGDVYGLEVPASHSHKTLAAYLDELFHGRVVIGDRASLGNAVLVVREMQEGRVSRVGLKLR
ncbi:MAG TPA: potassium/proton antiporter [Burkholderiales bacterium]|nr:potassium/proton antiporter [Burkholderiales bacterium]